MEEMIAKVRAAGPAKFFVAMTITYATLLGLVLLTAMVVVVAPPLLIAYSGYRLYCWSWGLPIGPVERHLLWLSTRF